MLRKSLHIGHREIVSIDRKDLCEKSVGSVMDDKEIQLVDVEEGGVNILIFNEIILKSSVFLRRETKG